MKVHPLFFCASIALLATAITDSLAQAPFNRVYELDRISEFLGKPDTIAFHPHQVQWKWSRQYLLIGRHVEDGCEYGDSGTIPANELPYISFEIARNDTTCEALLIEGAPKDDDWEALKQSFSFQESVANANATASPSYPPNTTTTLQLTIRYDDGNHPLIRPIREIFTFLAGSATARVEYHYNDEAPPSPVGDPTKCNVHSSQISLSAGGSSKGFLDWTQPLGESCLTVVVYVNGYSSRFAWDNDGRISPPVDFCDIPINANPPCRPDGYYQDQGGGNLRHALLLSFARNSSMIRLFR